MLLPSPNVLRAETFSLVAMIPQRSQRRTTRMGSVVPRVVQPWNGADWTNEKPVSQISR